MVRLQCPRIMDERERRNREWLEGEAALAATLTDADRVGILRSLLRAVAAIERSKPPEQLEREEQLLRAEREAGLARYRALAERLG